MVTFFLNLLAIGTILSSIFSITSKNPIISVIFLIITFVQAAGYLILIGVNFIGISYIVIYVGAIAVLFLFIIMMINIKLTDILESGIQYTKNLPLAIAIGSLFLYIIYTIIPFNFYNDPILYTIINKLILFNTEYNIIAISPYHHVIGGPTGYVNVLANVQSAYPHGTAINTFTTPWGM
jgi:NADH-ubiquinone oxidoreductase chain 6